MPLFDDCFDLIAFLEGGYQDNPDDSGNWTGAKIGIGELRGTKYGVSAAAHPTVDIENLTINGAKAIFREEYWNGIQGDHLPTIHALVIADAAYNSGVHQSVKWTQQASGANIDGIMGPKTLAAVHASDPVAFCTEHLAARLLFLTKLASWKTFGTGWTKRIVGLPFGAMAITLVLPSETPPATKAAELKESP